MTETPLPPLAVTALDVAPRARKSVYPAIFAARVDGREKRQLGDVFGLSAFGVNLTVLAPGGQSALMHRHTKQDEFVYILEGTPTLITDDGEQTLEPGMCAGFPAGGRAHHLVNRGKTRVVYLEIGDRIAGDAASYPQDDLAARLDPDGTWQFIHKDGRPY